MVKADIIIVGLHEREAALQAAQEAVDIRRELAAQRPDVFRPDLARSLIVLALRTSEMGYAEKAASIARNGVSTLKPEFLRYTDTHAGLMGAMLRDYLRLCKSAGEQPDFALLEGLRPYFIEKE